MANIISKFHLSEINFNPLEFVHIAQKYCSNIAKIFHCKIATLQKYCEILLQYFSNIADLKILICNIAAILQHNIYAILDFAHRGEILVVLLQKHCNNIATTLL